MKIEVTKLDVTLELNSSGNYDVLISGYYHGQIFKTQDGQRWEVNYKDRENFATPQEAAIRFLKNKALLEWDEDELS